nr:helix-turn-helix transcriptional regulator [uncultured Acetatifactor sp.]
MNKTERVRQGGSPIIGHNIRRLREQKHLRNIDLVAKLQLESIPISTSALSKIEQGACNPSTEQLVALQGILGCDYSDFFRPC